MPDFTFKMACHRNGFNMVGGFADIETVAGRNDQAVSLIQTSQLIGVPGLLPEQQYTHNTTGNQENSNNQLTNGGTMHLNRKFSHLVDIAS
jgi:hypothetical protein